MMYYYYTAGRVLENTCCVSHNDAFMRSGFTDTYNCLHECVSFKEKFCRNLEYNTHTKRCHGSSLPVALMPIESPCVGDSRYNLYVREVFKNAGTYLCRITNPLQTSNCISNVDHVF